MTKNLMQFLNKNFEIVTAAININQTPKFSNFYCLEFSFRCTIRTIKTHVKNK